MTERAPTPPESRPTRPDLDAIEARANAATAAPWVKDFGGTVGHIKANYPNEDGDTPTVAKYNVWSGLGISNDERNRQESRDGEFIARARADVPALVAYARHLEAEVERLRALGERLADGVAHVGSCRECGEMSPSTCTDGGQEAYAALKEWRAKAPEERKDP